MTRGRGRLIYFFALALLMLSAVFRLYSLRGDGGEAQTAIVSLYASGIHEKIPLCLEVEELLYDPSGEPVGRILSIESRPQAVNVYAAGELCQGVPEASEMVELKLKLAISGRKHEGRFLLRKNVFLSAGKTLELCGERTQIIYRILFVEVLE